MKALRVLPTKKGERGAAAIIVGIFVLLLGAGLAALGIDLSHLYVARNELQNAADAGALAGAQVLYNNEGTEINMGANDVAYQVATENMSEGIAVECDYVGGATNSGDIQRGHWSFGLGDSPRGFYPNASADVIVLAGLEDEELDEMDGQDGRDIFINAVRVRSNRRTTPIRSFFASIFGHPSSGLGAVAVAYRGFAGTLHPGDIDLPIAICEQSVIPISGTNEEYCTIGRMINSGNDSDTSETGAWTDFVQQDPDDPDSDDPCQGGAKVNSNDPPGIRDLLENCIQGNPGTLYGGEDMATTNGNVVGPALSNLIACWTSPDATNPVLNEDGSPMLDQNDNPVRIPIDFFTGNIDETNCVEDPLNCEPAPDGIPDVPWKVTLPLIDCGEGTVTTCAELTGAITLEIIWITGNHPVNKYQFVPDHMGNWVPPECDYEEDACREDLWNSLVEHFNLRNLPEEGGEPVSAPYAAMSLYFRPDCERAEMAGETGGHNFGVLARVPVLVK